MIAALTTLSIRLYIVSIVCYKFGFIIVKINTFISAEMICLSAATFSYKYCQLSLDLISITSVEQICLVSVEHLSAYEVLMCNLWNQSPYQMNRFGYEIHSFAT